MSKIALLIILILGLLVRFIGLDRLPSSLNWDEVSLGYNAYSLLLTGRDEWNQSFPTSFRAFGDYKLPLYVYAAVPQVKILGLTELAVRFPSALAGFLLIPIVYVMVRRLFPRIASAALISALLVAISPWTWFLSRLALEANLAVLISVLGLTLLISRRYLLSSLLLGMSLWTYNSFRLFVPALLLMLVLLHLKPVFKHFKQLILPTAAFVFLFIPMVQSLLSPGGQVRLHWLNILDSGAIAEIEQRRNTSSWPAPWPTLFYNRPITFAIKFSQNYFYHFLPNFLFIKGGDHYQFSVQNQGLLSWVNLPFFYLGILVLLRSQSKYKSLLLTWLLLAPIPGSLVRDAPHTLRAVTMLPLPMLFSSLGVTWVAQKLRSSKFIVSYLVLIALLSFVYLIRLVNYSRDYSASFQYGYKQLVDYIKGAYPHYDEIIITKRYGEPHEFVLFYWPWNPASFINNSSLIRYGRSDWFWVDSFDKFRFVNDWDMTNYVTSLDASKKYLLVTSPDSPIALPNLDRINFLNSDPAFLLKEK